MSRLLRHILNVQQQLLFNHCLGMAYLGLSRFGEHMHRCKAEGKELE